MYCPGAGRQEERLRLYRPRLQRDGHYPGYRGRCERSVPDSYQLAQYRPATRCPGIRAHQRHLTSGQHLYSSIALPETEPRAPTGPLPRHLGPAGGGHSDGHYLASVRRQHPKRRGSLRRLWLLLGSKCDGWTWRATTSWLELAAARGSKDAAV